MHYVLSEPTRMQSAGNKACQNLCPELYVYSRLSWGNLLGYQNVKIHKLSLAICFEYYSSAWLFWRYFINNLTLMLEANHILCSLMFVWNLILQQPASVKMLFIALNFASVVFMGYTYNLNEDIYLYHAYIIQTWVVYFFCPRFRLRNMRDGYFFSFCLLDDSIFVIKTTVSYCVVAVTV